MNRLFPGRQQQPAVFSVWPGQFCSGTAAVCEDRPRRSNYPTALDSYFRHHSADLYESDSRGNGCSINSNGAAVTKVSRLQKSDTTVAGYFFQIQIDCGQLPAGANLRRFNDYPDTIAAGLTVIEVSYPIANDLVKQNPQARRPVLLSLLGRFASVLPLPPGPSSLSHCVHIRLVSPTTAL